MKKLFLLIFINSAILFCQISDDFKPKLKSLVLPGWGEYSMGETKRARGFFIREALLWTTFLGLKKANKLYESDYRAFATIHADVNMSQKNYLFAVNIGHYENIQEYNNVKEKKRLVAEKYDEENFKWDWDSESNRIKYDKIRIQSMLFEKYAKFAMSALILHRLIAFIDVLYLERMAVPFDLNSDLSGSSESIKININFKFDI